MCRWDGWTILYVGALFVVDVFIAYFLSVLGMMGVIKYVTGSHVVTRVIKLIVAAFAIPFEVISCLMSLSRVRGNSRRCACSFPV